MARERENITAGASTLAAMSQNVANMGQIRQNMVAGTTQALNNVGNSFLQWQDDFNKRKYQKWMQGMEEAKLNEQKRLNDANIDIANRGMNIKETLLPYEIDSSVANTQGTRIDNATKNFNLGVERTKWNYIQKNNMLGDVIKNQYTTPKETGDNTATGTQPNATQGTNNGVEITEPAASPIKLSQTQNEIIARGQQLYNNPVVRN